MLWRRVSKEIHLKSRRRAQDPMQEFRSPTPNRPKPIVPAQALLLLLMGSCQDMEKSKIVNVQFVMMETAKTRMRLSSAMDAT